VSQVAYSLSVPRSKLAESILAEYVVGARSEISKKAESQATERHRFLR
jgi:hypothetical protein